MSLVPDAYKFRKMKPIINILEFSKNSAGQNENFVGE